MSRFTHASCDHCWFMSHHERLPDDVFKIEEPTRLVDADWDVCCECGRMTQSGIYVRADPGERRFCTHDLPADAAETN